MGYLGDGDFQTSTRFNPDIDDTTASLRSIARNVQNDPVSVKSWEKGILGFYRCKMTDGGWPAFEKNTK